MGIIYVNKDKKSFEENLTVYREKQDPLVFRELNRKDKLEQLLNQKK